MKIMGFGSVLPILTNPSILYEGFKFNGLSGEWKLDKNAKCQINISKIMPAKQNKVSQKC